jgi:site-specific recombinase XerD
MATTSTAAVDDLRTLVVSFERALRARNRSPRTIKGYGDSVRLFVDYLDERGMPTRAVAITREHVEAFIEDQLSRWTSSTAATRYRCLQQFWKWAQEDGEVATSPMANMKPPTLDERETRVLSEAQVRDLLRSCDGQGFTERRDAAIIRTFVDSGIRLGELVALRVEDVDLDAGVVKVERGKGARFRLVAIGPRTAQALDRYLRMRARHSERAQPWLWLGAKGPMTDSGVAQMLRRRARDAGIPHLHPHMLRHTAVDRLLAKGLAEGDAMKLMGWRSSDMLRRYAAATAAPRALDAHHRLGAAEEL